MQYGIIIQSGDARAFAGLAREAEAAGWDGVFIADAIDIGLQPGSAYPMFDPWVVLAAMAMRTERVRIGTIITPVSRRRPWKLARETMTLDQLSGGRLTLAVGLGAAEHDGGFYKVGEAMDLKARAKLLDESLEILGGLWSGEPFSFSGEHYQVQEMTMLPRPVQSPRIPVWVVGVWPRRRSLERALRWDGIIPQKYKASPGDRMSPADIRTIKNYVDEHHPQPDRFDILAGMSTSGKSRKRALEIVRPFAEAGATWWVEEVWAAEPKLLARIKQGPPRVE
jgi:alkanesulfonate monooxygenase SsuD/methylene tetrahydromethanopterin reductase-like flavin-dependent oxidoreductase (luciferase family)